MTRYPKTVRSLATLTGMMVLAGSSAVAPITFQPESKLWVDGTSTVRSYSCKATTMRGSVQSAEAGATLEMAQLRKAVRTVEVAVPVQGLECGNGTMNGHLRKALKAEENPTVKFELSQYDLVAGGGSEGAVTLKGRLVIAGQEKPVTIQADLSTDAAGTLRVKGSKELLMSEYGVKAPTLMMGTLKVRDRVVVNFDVVLKQS